METLKLSKAGIRSVKLESRDAGFEHETKDCFVKALAAVTGVPYRDAHAFCRDQMDRRDRKGTCPEKPMLRYQTSQTPIFGYRVFKQEAVQGTRVKRNLWGNMTSYPAYRTLVSFVKTHPTGRYLVWSNYHALAVIDGVVYDNGAAGARQQITGVYKFVASSQVERGEQ